MEVIEIRIWTTSLLQCLATGLNSYDIPSLSDVIRCVRMPTNFFSAQQFFPKHSPNYLPPRKIPPPGKVPPPEIFPHRFASRPGKLHFTACCLLFYLI